MADAFLASMLVHSAQVYHLGATEAVDGQVLESYPALPDIAALAGALHQDGKTLSESAVGYLIESDAIWYCENADVRERDKLVILNRIFYVNGTPSRYYNVFDPPNANVPHLLEVGLREHKDQPA